MPSWFLSPMSKNTYRWWSRKREDIRVLRGVVYMTKSRGPRTEGVWSLVNKYTVFIERTECVTLG